MGVCWLPFLNNEPSTIAPSDTLAGGDRAACLPRPQSPSPRSGTETVAQAGRPRRVTSPRRSLPGATPRAAAGRHPPVRDHRRKRRGAFAPSPRFPSGGAWRRGQEPQLGDPDRPARRHRARPLEVQVRPRLPPDQGQAAAAPAHEGEHPVLDAPVARRVMGHVAALRHFGIPGVDRSGGGRAQPARTVGVRAVDRPAGGDVGDSRSVQRDSIAAALDWAGTQSRFGIRSCRTLLRSRAST